MRRFAAGIAFAASGYLYHNTPWRTARAQAHAPALDVEEAGAEYDYDLVVIGGGSGGLAAAKRAVQYGKTVALCDFVQPTHIGTQWGLGGTCVNVGCIPKKLMHEAALRGDAMGSTAAFGWQVGEARPTLDWGVLQQNAENYIRSLNFGYVMQLRTKGVKYFNAYATLTDAHTVQCKDKKGKVKELTARRVLLAPGGRPTQLGIPGEEHCITSDDLFRRTADPGRTLVVGAGYIGLECAGMLHGIGRDATLMVRSKPLRTMDQDMATRLTAHLKATGMDIRSRALPKAVVKRDDGRLDVTWTDLDTAQDTVEAYDTVLIAAGRSPRLDDVGVAKVGVEMARSGKVLVDSADRTAVPNVYAVGDVVEGVPELTPVASKAGILLMDRLYGGKDVRMDYRTVPTTVFSPLEYGFVGLSEEAAAKELGDDRLEVFHSELVPLEWELPHLSRDACYMKMLVDRETDKVLGFHFLGPHAGEVVQGVAVALTAGATKAQFDASIGIHPTVAEAMTTLTVTKRSGQSAAATGC